MKWFDKDIYAKFVMRKILLEQFTLRSFRLNTEIPMVVKFDNDVNSYHNTVSIHQLSEVGMIVKIAAKAFVEMIKSSRVIDCTIPVLTYEKVQELNFNDSLRMIDDVTIVTDEYFKTYKLDSRIFNFYGNMTNVLRSGQDEFYIFARYEDLLPVGHDTGLAGVFVPLVLKVKKDFTKELGAMAGEKLAA
jgi:hypothetical protein